MSGSKASQVTPLLHDVEKQAPFLHAEKPAHSKLRSKLTFKRMSESAPSAENAKAQPVLSPAEAHKLASGGSKEGAPRLLRYF